MTTDHISPAGAIKKTSPGGKFPPRKRRRSLQDFNSYGSRRGNDRIMTRGTFANVRIKNLMLGGEEGGNTLFYRRLVQPAVGPEKRPDRSRDGFDCARGRAPRKCPC